MIVKVLSYLVCNIARYTVVINRIARYIDKLEGLVYDKGMGTDKLFTLDSETARAIAARRKVKVRRCPICGAEFTTVGRGLYDSPRCARRAAYARQRQRKENSAGS